MRKELVFSKNQAFTLIEMAVILVIIGLLAGGIILGRDLVKQSQIRQMISQINEYNTATNAFRTKYNELPGDTARAMAFGFADPACPLGVGVTPPVVPGCNGNGDGVLTSNTADAENINYWYHLSKAGMIEGAFDGMTNLFGSGAPSVKIRDSTGFYIGTSNIFPGYNMFIVGLDDTINGSYHLFPAEAWAVDNRMDDGLPETGIVRTPTGFDPDCYSSPPNGQYNLDNDSPVCAIFMRSGF